MECVCEILLVTATTDVGYLSKGAKVEGVRDVKYV